MAQAVPLRPRRSTAKLNYAILADLSSDLEQGLLVRENDDPLAKTPPDLPSSPADSQSEPEAPSRARARQKSTKQPRSQKSPPTQGTGALPETAGLAKVTTGGTVLFISLDVETDGSSRLNNSIISTGCAATHDEIRDTLSSDFGGQPSTFYSLVRRWLAWSASHPNLVHRVSQCMGCVNIPFA